MLDSGALYIDETPIRCLKSDKTNGYMWAMSSADTGSTLYYWQNSRSADTLNHLLRHGMQKDGRVYEGAILSDGYGGYESWMKHLPEDQKPQWQDCWAHVRRKFVEAAGNSNDPGWSMKMVDLIRPLYVIERELRESKAPPEDKLKERMKKIPTHRRRNLPRTHQAQPRYTKSSTQQVEGCDRLCPEETRAAEPLAGESQYTH